MVKIRRSSRASQDGAGVGAAVDVAPVDAAAAGAARSDAAPVARTAGCQVRRWGRPWQRVGEAANIRQHIGWVAGRRPLTGVNHNQGLPTVGDRVVKCDLNPERLIFAEALVFGKAAEVLRYASHQHGRGAA